MPENNQQVLETVTLAGGGVVKRVLCRGEEGECPPRHAQVKVHYTGRLEDGSVFDSSRDRGQPFEFRLGEGQVIKGWDAGVASMAVGERAELVCRPDHAYGSLGSPPKIPADATLTFDVELLSFNTKKPVTEDGGVMKEVLSAGDGFNRPNVFATARVRVEGRVGGKDGRVFRQMDAEPVEMVLDEDAARPRGLDEAVKNMLAGERARFYVRADYGYGAAGSEEAGVPPNQPLVYEIELASFEKGRETWEMAHEEKVDHGDRLKARGNAEFKRRQWEQARVWYRRAGEVFQYEPKELTDEQLAAVKRLKTQAGSNLAACALQAKDYAGAVKDATEALEADANNAKALSRRGTAHLHMGEWDLAEADLARAAELDPSSAAATKLLQHARKRKRDVAQKERKLYSNMFERVDLS